MPFGLTSAAEADLDEIADEIGERQGDSASARWLDAITRRFELLGTMPRMGRTRDHDLGLGRRSVLFRNYVIVYRVSDSTAIILRVVHGRRDLSQISFGG